MKGTLVGIFLDAVSAHDKRAQFMRRAPTGWEEISARRALTDVEGLAAGLRDLGVSAGDRVAILSESRYEWPVSDLAILGLGAVTVPIYPTLVASQCRFILESSGSKAAIVSDATQAKKLQSVAKELPRLETIICMDSAAEVPGTLSLESLSQRRAGAQPTNGAEYRTSAARVRPDDTATIIYTSGTTGEPKGAVLTHGNIASNVEACLQVVELGSDDACLSFLPLCHIFERMAGLYAMLRAGATIAYAEGLEKILANAAEVRPTVLTGVPRFYEKAHARVLESAAALPGLRRRIFFWGLRQGLARARARFEGKDASSFASRLADRLVGSKIRERFGGRLRFCISGGAPLHPKTMEFFFAIGIPVIEGYGLTETSPVICLNVPGKEKPGSVGPPIPGVEIRIGPEGEILTRGPHVMRGYFKNPEATAAAIRNDWFHTGDVGRIDPDGRLVITDRLKDLLVTAGGKKVAPQPLEARLKSSRWITEAIMIGDRRPYVICLLVPDFAALESEAGARGWRYADRRELIARPEVLSIFQSEIDRLNRDLSSFEQIKRFALLNRDLSQDDGELTPTLKVRRGVVTERFAGLIEELYSGDAPRAPGQPGEDRPVGPTPASSPEPSSRS